MNNEDSELNSTFGTAGRKKEGEAICAICELTLDECRCRTNVKNAPEENLIGAEARERSECRELPNETHVQPIQPRVQEVYQNRTVPHDFDVGDFCIKCSASRADVEDGYVGHACKGEPLIEAPTLYGHHEGYPLLRAIADSFHPGECTCSTTFWHDPSCGNQNPVDGFGAIRRDEDRDRVREIVREWQARTNDINPPEGATLYGGSRAYEEYDTACAECMAGTDDTGFVVEGFKCRRHDGVSLRSSIHPHPHKEVDPQLLEVVLPDVHWMRVAFEHWQKGDEYATYVQIHDEQQEWLAFRAGANAIPGNPDRIASLEKQLADISIDHRTLVVERQLEDADFEIAAHTKMLAEQMQLMGELGKQVTKLDEELTEYDKGWTERLNELMASATEAKIATRDDIECIYGLLNNETIVRESHEQQLQSMYRRREAGIDKLQTCVARIDLTISEVAKQQTHDRSMNYERWGNLESHVERIRDESNAKDAVQKTALDTVHDALTLRLDACDRALMALTGMIDSNAKGFGDAIGMLKARELRVTNERLYSLEATANAAIVDLTSQVRELTAQVERLESYNNGTESIDHG